MLSLRIRHTIRFLRRSSIAVDAASGSLGPASTVTPRRYRGANNEEKIDDDNHRNRMGAHTHHAARYGDGARRHDDAETATAASCRPRGELFLPQALLERETAAVYPKVRVALGEQETQGGEGREHSQRERAARVSLLEKEEGEGDACVGAALYERSGGQNMENEVQAFLYEKQREMERTQVERNAAIPYPTHPDDMVPEFRRIKRHQTMVVVATDPDCPVFARRDQFVPLPPPALHPWVKNTPIGPFILHGDGQLKVAGSGEVGFDNTHATETLPRDFRGLQHRSVLQQRLPQKNGKVIQDAVVKNSFTLTGRGVFATREIAAGETIMIVRNTARNLGVKTEVERLVEMCGDVLLAAYEGTEADRSYLHDWILTGQPSSLLEHWPAYATERVLERIGGLETLRTLELHETHVARLASIIDMNSFLVESSYAVRKGMAYFPEAGFLNHSCAPNATYDVIPEHTFCETDYYVDELVEKAEGRKTMAEDSAAVLDTKLPLCSPCVNVSETRVLHFGSDTECGGDKGDVKNGNYDGGAAEAPREDDVAIAAPVQYLFCCRATDNIPAGAEILISYVPPDWSFDNRQYVLHDRYRFWCKCRKCAPTLDGQYARVPRLILVLLLLSVFLQLLVLHLRDAAQTTVREEFERDADSRGGLHSPGRRPRGLFEAVEEDKLREMYAFDAAPLPAHVANDTWARPPR